MTPYYEDESSGIVIYHGDCRDVLPQLAPVDLVLTDPPYGLGLQGGTWGKKFLGEYDDWDARVISDLRQIIGLGAIQVVWGGNYYELPATRGWLSWYKPDAPPTMAHFELAWTNQDRNARQISHSIAATNGERYAHPTQKPLAVMLWCLGQFPKAQTVLDPFMGSGTTLVAAKQLGRRAIGIEICEDYCRIAVERLRQDVLPFAEPAAQPIQEALPI
jgi:DNA modification methylase